MLVSTISIEILINHLKDTLCDPDNKICFILGSGASMESGIDCGATLAKKWYRELPKFHSLEKIDEWKAKVRFDENDIPSFYSNLFKFRYEGHREDGIHEITSIIEKGSPGFGYTILSQIMQRTKHNVVVTTNFDTLTEESLLLFTNKRALICNHENIAHLARPSSIRPLIIKIHRGLYMDPMNDEDEIAKIKPQWEEVLTNIFTVYIPIVIGYGGNDGSLMDYLKRIRPCRRMYWCLNTDHRPNSDIIEVIERHNGSFVLTGGFNRMMFRFIDLFKLTKIHEGLEHSAGERAEKLRKQFEEAGKGIGITGTDQEKNELIKIANDFDTSDWLQWQLKVMAANDENKKEIYLQALNILPLSHELRRHFADFLEQLNQYDDAINNLRLAIEIKPAKYELWIDLGIIYRKKNQFDDAIDAYYKAIEIKFDSHEAWYNIGNLFYLKGKYPDAIIAYNKAVLLKLDKEEAWSNLGVAYYENEDYFNAILSYKRAIEIKPEKEETWCNLGNSYAKIQQYKNAEDAYKISVEINPENLKVWITFWSFYKLINDSVNANMCYEMVQKLYSI